MRLVKLLVAENDRDPVLGILKEEGIDYVLFGMAHGEELGGEHVLVEFPLPNQAVEHVQRRLDEADLGEEYVITVTAESAHTEGIDALEERFVTGTEAGDSISTDELRTTALDLNPDPLPYHLMTLMSAIVAVAGLLLDSAALVVGAMVIAPQVGSALLASVGASIGDWRLLRQGVREQVLGLSLAIVGAAVFGVALQWLGFVSPGIHLGTIAEVGERISPGVLTLTVGIAAGVAGAVGIATALPVSLVGVMIAAALIPAAAATGIGLAWNDPGVAMGAFVMLAANFVAVNVFGIVTLRAFGYQSTVRDRETSETLKTAVVAVFLLGLVVFTASAYAVQASFEHDVRAATTDVLGEEEYEEISLVQTRARFILVPGSEDTVVEVVVQRPVDQQYPTLAEDLAEAIAAVTDRRVTVEVEFVDRQHHGGAAAD